MDLSKEQINHFKKKLIELRNNIVRSVQETKEEVKNNEESKGYSQHQADEGTDYFDKTISLELSNKEMDILERIDRALKKIDEGTYGICDVTKKQIPIARLEAIPYATMTVQAQEEYEKKNI